MSQLPIQFDRPIWLLLLLLLIPCYLLARKSAGGMSRGKATLVFALRAIVLLLLAATLAHPVWARKGKGVTVTILLDRSLSIPLQLKQQAQKFLQEAVQSKGTDDRVAVITLAKEATIAAMPDPNTDVTLAQESGDLTATNLAAGIRLALAITPDDTANRFVLVSDGNETDESVMAAAQVAKANNIPIDVLVQQYEHRNEVVFDRVVAPARARIGQSANVKLVLRSQGSVPGRVSLKMNGLPIDLNGADAGDALEVTLQPGTTVLPVTVSLDDAGPQQFQAIFEPDDPRDDMVDQNNSGVAVTYVSGEGRVLVVGDGETESEKLVAAMQAAKIQVDLLGPDQIEGLVQLSGYDAVIFVDIPRYAMTDQQVRDLHAYVHDLGGGFLMVGGPESFGAGGWIDSDVAKLLPVDLDPPQTRQMPRGALALIMHSCEMAQGNFWGEKVAIAAIEALSRLDYVGITVFGWGGGGVNGSTWAFKMQPVGDKSAAIAAAKTMQVGDMPSFDDSMELAYQGLTDPTIRAGQRHAIIISDGDPSAPSNTVLQKYIKLGITVTAIMVGGHGTQGDMNKMNAIATQTGGRFYNITNPNKLPAIFIKEAHMVSRSLIQEGAYNAAVASHLPGPAQGYSTVPGIQGYILTGLRSGLAQTPIVIPTTEGNDPLYAYWNYGLGRSMAFTADLYGKWGQLWVKWSEFVAFWEQSIRWLMRPASPQNMSISTRVEGDRALVEIEALNADSSFENFLQTDAVVITPNADAKPLSLQQVGPGRYSGEFKTDEAGAYLVNVTYRAGAANAPSSQGSLQAAVAVPYSREFRSVRDNRALMIELAESTKGRQLDPSNPQAADLFNKDTLPVPSSPRPVWDLLAIIAACLFVVDVAARRLAMDLQVVRNFIARMRGRRGDASGETVAAWRKARSSASHRRDAKTIVRDADEPAPDPKARFKASEEEVAKGVDFEKTESFDGDSGLGQQHPAPAKPKPAEEDEDYTSRLLAAKRRAQNRKDSGEGHDGGQKS
ncbi:MAG TPA: VWA domain-containing protein [Phycisphaerales bacterium]|nr:VWA domain-containing protein [Phycisphaerales bacterium]